ncbi:M28 family peptidase [Halanaeroarchaeum sulfurireducens]|nr:M28 family peptidase [Halanaeroarchaeum sulfurireducens]
MTAWIGDLFRSDVGWNHLETLVDVPNRMAGTAGEREGAARTRGALDEFARDARLDEFAIQGWERGSTTIETPAGTADGIALPRSPADDVTGRFVDLGHGLPEDFEQTDVEDAIVMVSSDVPDWYDRFVHRKEKYYYAVRDGAAGFVFANHYEGCLPPTGSVGNADDPIGEIPAVGVSKEVGARLRRRFEGQMIHVAVEADVSDATSQNVHAELGPDTDEELLVTSHVDAHDIAEGAMDNGAGTAMVVEIARVLAEREDELDTRVHFVTYGAEEVGLVGSSHDAATRDRETVRAIVNIDGIVQARTLSVHTHGFDALGDAVTDLAEDFGHPVHTTPRQSTHSDHWPYVQWGVPGYHVTSETGDEGRGWGHTYGDTFDKLERRTFREQAVLLVELVRRLADDGFDVAHVSPDVIAAALEAEDEAEGLKVIGNWPY